MEINVKKKEKISRLATVLLVGILLLVIVIPAKKDEDASLSENSDTTGSFSYADYYEQKLKTILERSYGDGTMYVMVHMSEKEQSGSIYSSDSMQPAVDGVLVVADVDSGQAVSDITFAVCALFDLPAHKVAVMIKN